MARMLLLLILICGAHVYAQEGDADPTKEAAPAAAQPDKAAAADNATVETPDSFDPSEQLSEDVPAAFPVDI